jgi:RNA polymerase sigma-70 factor (ECF subfamily)
MNDIEVVKALKENNRDAFKQIFECHYDRLVIYITTFTRNQMLSEDIVQQSFINLWNHRAKLDADKSPKNYLYAIAYNKYIDHIKKEKRQHLFLEDLWERSLRERINEDEDLIEKRILKMRQIIDTLPPKCKEIIQLNKIQGIKYKDIAKMMGVSVKTVEAQMRIAFKKIRTAFKNDQLMLFILFDSIKES